MENNLFEILSQLLSKGSPQNSGQTTPPSNPYYPSEAYPNGQYNFNNSGFNNGNSILPMLLSLMGGNSATISALSNVLGGGSDTNILSSLLKQQKSSSQSDEQEHIIPSDDILL